MNKIFMSLGAMLIFFGLAGCGESETDKLARLQMEKAQQTEQRAAAARDRRLNNKSNLIGDALKTVDTTQGTTRND